MTFQQDDLFKNDNSFGAVSQRFVFPRVAATDFVAEIDGSFPGKAPRDLSHLSQVNFLFKLKMISAKNSSLIFDRNILIKFQLKCLGARRAPRNFNLGDHLLGLGTQAKTPGSPKGSQKFSLEHSLVIIKRKILLSGENIFA